MNPVLRRLQQEHEQFRKTIVLMTQHLNEENIDVDTLHVIGAYLLEAIAHCHEPKERLLMRLIRSRSIWNSDVDHVEHDHDLLVADLRHLVARILSAKDGVETDANFRTYCRNALDHISRHMTVEERSMFPLAQRVLADEDWIQLRRYTGRGDDPLFGYKIADKYDRMYEHVIGLTKLTAAALA